MRDLFANEFLGPRDFRKSKGENTQLLKGCYIPEDIDKFSIRILDMEDPPLDWETDKYRAKISFTKESRKLLAGSLALGCIYWGVSLSNAARMRWLTRTDNFNELFGKSIYLTTALVKNPRTRITTSGLQVDGMYQYKTWQEAKRLARLGAELGEEEEEG